MNETINLHGEVLKQLQQTELEILKVVSQFCDSNRITYFLSSGTLLGAVRHEGFIPWDDDVDISMPRKDFERFLSIAKQLPYPYVCQATRIEGSFTHMMAKVRKHGTIMKEPAMAHLNIEHGVWIDVFPLDRVKNVKILPIRINLVGLLTTAMGFKVGVRSPKKIKTRLACYLLSLLGNNRLDKIRTKIMMAEEYSNGKKLTSFASNLGAQKLLLSEDVYFPTKKMTFEDTQFTVPGEWNTWLKGGYGDYMKLPPTDQQVNKHPIIELRL